MESASESERFAGLLLRYRGRTHLTQSQLASRTGVHARSVQSWEAGVSYPTADRLEALIPALLQTGAFTPGRETAEAEALWRAALHEAPRMSVPFDWQWFVTLLAGPSPRTLEAEPMRQSEVAEPISFAQHREDWADAPDVTAT